MVKVVRDPDIPFRDPHVDMTVYRSPRDREVIFGVWGYDRQTGPQEVTFYHSGFGVPVARTYRDALAFCEKNGIETLLLIDPEGLFTEPKRVLRIGAPDCA